MTYINLDDALSTIAAHLAPCKDMMEEYENKINDWFADCERIEIVRCKDCKHNYRRTTWNHGERDNPACKYTNYVRDNDFYCSYGERGEA